MLLPQALVVTERVAAAGIPVFLPDSGTNDKRLDLSISIAMETRETGAQGGLLKP